MLLDSLSPLLTPTLLLSLLPLPKKFPGASLRDRATLPSPLRGLVPSGGYPSRLRSLRSLRAPLAPAVRCAHRRLPLRRHGGLRRRSGRSAAAASPRGRYAPGALRRRSPTAHPPRRLTSGSGPGTVLPIVDLVGSGLSHGPGPATLSHRTQPAALYCKHLFCIHFQGVATTGTDRPMPESAYVAEQSPNLRIPVGAWRPLSGKVRDWYRSIADRNTVYYPVTAF